MSVRVPALPALVAGQALKSEAAASAQRTLGRIRQMLASYDLARDLLDDVPLPAREALASALHRRLRAAGQSADLCRERLDEVEELCASLRDAPSPVAIIDVPDDLFEMLSPYMDEAMEPVLFAISRRVGPGCTAEEVNALFPRPQPAHAP